MSFLRKSSLIFCQSFLLFITSLLYICLSVSYSHCISSILSDSLCFFCRSFSFLRQFFPFFAFSVVLFLAYVTSLYLSLNVVISLHFVNSHRLCLLFLSFFVFPQFFPYFVFFCRSFSFLRNYCIFVFRCCFPTVFRQFSPFLLAFSVILSFSYISIFDSLFRLSFLLFPTSLLCICLSMSYSHSISLILSDFVCLLCRSFTFLRQSFPYFVFSVVLSPSYVTTVYLSFAVV